MLYVLPCPSVSFFNSTHSNLSQDACLEAVKTATLGLSYHYLVGNHDLYCFSRTEIHQRYPNMQTRAYYSTSLVRQKFRLIFLDTYDISCICPTNENNEQRALKYLFDNNSNIKCKEDLKGGDWLNGVPEDMSRFVPFNGGISKEQLEWLNDELNSALECSELVILISHVPLAHQAGASCNTVFNLDEVSEIIHREDTPVVAVISGHDHSGDYFYDKSTDIHHIIPCSPLECAKEEVAFTLMELGHRDKGYIELKSEGKLPERKWPDRLIFSRGVVGI